MEPRVTPNAGSIPHPQAAATSRNESRPTASVSRLHAGGLRAAALVLLLVLGSLAALGLANNATGGSRLMLAQDTASPSDTSTHPIIGAWESADGVPCWCLSVFTDEGVVIGLDPTHEDSTSGMSSQSIAMGFWEPTGEHTALGVVRMPMDNGGYLERSIHRTVNEDGLTATGSGTQRAINENGDVFTMGGSPPINIVRMGMPEESPVATPTD